MTKLLRKLNRAVDRFCARRLSAKARHYASDPGNMQALRREMGMPEWRRGA